MHTCEIVMQFCWLKALRVGNNTLGAVSILDSHGINEWVGHVLGFQTEQYIADAIIPLIFKNTERS